MSNQVQCSSGSNCGILINNHKCPHDDPHIRNEWCKAGFCPTQNKELSCVEVNQNSLR